MKKFFNQKAPAPAAPEGIPQRLVPGQAAPALEVPLVGGGHFNVYQAKAQHFIMLVFYRGYNCHICRNTIHDLNTKLPQFKELGVTVAAISSDEQAHATMSKEEWHVPGLDVGYALPMETARAWGLYLSKGHGHLEPEYLNEPALFLLTPKHKLFGLYVQSLPFSRPRFDELLEDLRYIIDNRYEARGTE